MSDPEVELDLDRLEQLPDDLRMVTVMQGRNMADYDFAPTFRALVKRLREAESGRDWAIEQSKRASIRWNRDLQRIAQLERVREAVIQYLGDYIDRGALDAALAAVEKK